VDLRGRSLRTCRQVVARPEVRRGLPAIGRRQLLHALLREGGCRGLERAGAEMLDLAGAGATAAETWLYPQTLIDLHADLYVGLAREPRAALELAEQAVDTREDLLQVEGLLAAPTSGETAAHLRDRAAALRAQGAASFALADRLEFDARTRERAA